MSTVHLSVGIDVCKRWLDAFAEPLGYRRFANSPEGVDELAAWIGGSEASVGLEATGSHHVLAAERLAEAGCSVHVYNPRRVKQLAGGLGFWPRPTAWTPGSSLAASRSSSLRSRRGRSGQAPPRPLAPHRLPDADPRRPEEEEGRARPERTSSRNPSGDSSTRWTPRSPCSKRPGGNSSKPRCSTRSGTATSLRSPASDPSPPEPSPANCPKTSRYSRKTAGRLLRTRPLRRPVRRLQTAVASQVRQPASEASAVHGRDAGVVLRSRMQSLRGPAPGQRQAPPLRRLRRHAQTRAASDRRRPQKRPVAGEHAPPT